MIGHAFMFAGSVLALVGVVMWLRSIADETEKVDVHAHRKPLSRFCRTPKSCSINDCIFPACEEPPPAPRKK